MALGPQKCTHIALLPGGRGAIPINPNPTETTSVHLVSTLARAHLPNVNFDTRGSLWSCPDWPRGTLPKKVKKDKKNYPPPNEKRGPRGLHCVCQANLISHFDFKVRSHQGAVKYVLKGPQMGLK